MLRKLPAIILILSSAGCCGRAAMAPPAVLPDVPAPVLPTLDTARELACVSDDTYAKLVKRDRLLKGALAECQAVIRSTHPE